LETDRPSHTSTFSDRLFYQLDRLPLSLLLLLSLAGYTLLVFWFPLTPYHKLVPLSDIRSFTPSLGEGFVYGCFISLLYALFWLAYRRVRRSSRPPGLLKILGIATLFALPLLLTYPVNANDIYRYVIRGRIFSIYGESPFSVAPNAFPNDPFLPLAGEWAGVTSPYGPLWEITASLLTNLSGDNLLLGLLFFKGLALLAFMGSAVLLWSTVRFAASGAAETHDAASRAANTILWAWNPALLLTFVTNAHNDALMIFWLLLGFVVIRRGHLQAGFLLMFLGPLTKPIGVLALPLFFLRIWHDIATIKLRLRFLLVTFAGGLILLTLSFLPFGSPLELAQRLLHEAAAGGGFSLAVLLILMAQKLNLPFSVTLAAQIALLLFGLFVLWLLWKTWRGRSPVRGTADIFYGYLLQALNFRIWYAAWPFPWLILDAGEHPQAWRTAYRLHYGLWFLLTTQLSVLIYAQVRIFLLGGDQLQAHLLGVLFTFGAPFLLARYSKKSGF
jgi:alpha-1,6-mannosyltransferase